MGSCCHCPQVDIMQLACSETLKKDGWLSPRYAFFLFLCWLWPLSQPFLWIISYSNQTVAHHQTSWFLSSYLNELSYTYHFSKILQNIAQLHSWSHTNSIRAGVGPNQKSFNYSYKLWEKLTNQKMFSKFFWLVLWSALSLRLTDFKRPLCPVELALPPGTGVFLWKPCMQMVVMVSAIGADIYRSFQH